MTMVQHIIQYKYIYQAAIMYNELLQQRRQRAVTRRRVSHLWSIMRPGDDGTDR